MIKTELGPDISSMIERAAIEIMEDTEIVFDKASISQAIIGFTDSIWASPSANKEIDRAAIEMSLKEEIKKTVIERIEAKARMELNKLNAEISQYYHALLYLQLVDQPFEEFVAEIKGKKAE